MATLEQEIEKLNLETGEVTRESTVIKKVRCDEPPYAKFYLDGWLGFKQIKSVNHSFLFELMPYTAYADGGQLLSLTSHVKRKIGKKLGWKEETVLNRFNHELCQLVKTGVLKRIDRSAYVVNPELIGKGDWKDIRRLRVTFNLETGDIYHEYAPDWDKEAPVEENSEEQEEEPCQ